MFLSWLNVASLNLGLGLDAVVSEYVEFLYENGEPINIANDTVAGIQFFLPFRVAKLVFSWRLCRQWSREEPPSRAAPFCALASCLLLLECLGGRS